MAFVTAWGTKQFVYSTHVGWLKVIKLFSSVLQRINKNSYKYRKVLAASMQGTLGYIIRAVQCLSITFYSI